MCEQCDELRERVRQLEDRAYGWDMQWEAPSWLRLTRMQEGLLRVLLVGSGRTVSRDHLYEATRVAISAYRSSTDIKIVDVVLSHVRSKLRPVGIEIETVWGRGYRLTPENAQRLAELPMQRETVDA